MILQTSFDALISPEFLTEELSIFVGVLLIVMLYASIRYRSLIATFGWAVMVVSLMVTVLTNFQLIWFWLAVVLEAFLIVLAAIQYARMAARQ